MRSFRNDILNVFVELLLPSIKGLLHNLVIDSIDLSQAPLPLTTFDGEML